jgi:hypothetical protein
MARVSQARGRNSEATILGSGGGVGEIEEMGE